VDITGFPAAYFVEDPDRLKERIRPEDHAALDASMSTGPDASSGLATYHFRRQDGSWIWLEDHYTPQRDEDGNVIGSQGIMLDVSARIELEQARQAALDYERQASERLRDTLAQQRQFLQAVSHEVRTPLTTVLGYSQLLKTSGDQLEGERLQKVVDGLYTQTQRLADLLNDLIDADRLAGSLAEPDMAELDFSALCNQIAANAQLPDHHLIIEVDEAIRLMGDRDMLQKVVAQLLENAGKHTPRGTQVWVRLHTDGDQVILTVEDDGPGVPEHLLDTMFEPFVQGPQSNELANPGTGIGLALVQRYVAVHRGSVRSERREPTGTRLAVRLPAMAPAGDQMGVSAPS
jgi:signal transduction histidine kinase